jgi:hypothetical protein
VGGVAWHCGRIGAGGGVGKLYQGEAGPSLRSG